MHARPKNVVRLFLWILFMLLLGSSQRAIAEVVTLNVPLIKVEAGTSFDDARVLAGGLFGGCITDGDLETGWAFLSYRDEDEAGYTYGVWTHLFFDCSAFYSVETVKLAWTGSHYWVNAHWPNPCSRLLFSAYAPSSGGGWAHEIEYASPCTGSATSASVLFGEETVSNGIADIWVFTDLVWTTDSAVDWLSIYTIEASAEVTGTPIPGPGLLSLLTLGGLALLKRRVVQR